MIVQDIRNRLLAVLPSSVPILLPEQQREPLEAAPVDAQGRPVVGGGERGLGTYLRQHPQGYVQVEQPLAIGSDGLSATYWVAVAVIHTSGSEAETFGWVVYRALAGWPWAPCPYREVTPGQPETLSPGVWMVRRTYSTSILDGQQPRRT